MIYSLRLGKPIETEAVVNEGDIRQCSETEFIERIGTLGGELRVESATLLSEKQGVNFKYQMKPKTAVYGLGESLHGINKRGFRYVSDNTDEPHQTPEKLSLYGAHNFIVIKDAEEDFGLFFDYPAAMEFDMGFTDHSMINIDAPGKDMVIYLITGECLLHITEQFRGIIGKSYTAPLWAFGFGQSRWGYKCEDDIREIVNKYRMSGIPLDSVYMDIDYMQDFKDFTINRERFPRFGSFVNEMEEQGIHLVPIIDAGVKIENGYDIYEEGKSFGYFCTNDDSSLFQAAVWPGMTHFVDFFKPEARKWFGLKYANLTDYGIEGFWNDMNEPSIFYTQKKLEETLEKIEDMRLREEPLNVDDCHAIRESIDSWTSHENYKDFYHIINGRKVSHDKVHNLYGYQMTRAAAEGLEELLPDKRPLLFSRSSYIGMHRYSGIWMGDNASRWEHLKMNLQMLTGLNMCGFIYSGADIGGFGDNVNEELLLRWVALGIFIPLFRNHCAIGCRDQELFRFENTEMFKNIVSLRYRLIPYIFSEYLKAVNEDKMLFRPLVFDYEEDEAVADIEDQLMLGESIMIAPVLEPNARGRYVYLPEDMLFVKFETDSEYTCEVMSRGYHHIQVALNEIPVFIRKGKILPLGSSCVCTADMCRFTEAAQKGELSADNFEIISFADQTVMYDMWFESRKNITVNTIFYEKEIEE